MARRCGTPLSAQEVAQGYKDVKERSAIVRFKVVNEDAYILAWTTTPWTLPSNIGLCVHPEEDYAKVKAADGNVYYMAQALLDTVLGKLAPKNEDGEKLPAYEVLETYKGKDLEYKEYEPLYACAKEVADKQRKKCFHVVCDTYVVSTRVAPDQADKSPRQGTKKHQHNADLGVVTVSKAVDAAGKGADRTAKQKRNAVKQHTEA